MDNAHVQVFKALGNPVRLEIFRLLLIEPLCNCELTVLLDSSQSSTSQHLKIMMNAGLVENFKIGQWTFYRANEEKLTAANNYVCGPSKEDKNNDLKTKVNKVISADYCSIRLFDGSLPEDD